MTRQEKTDYLTGKGWVTTSRGLWWTKDGGPNTRMDAAVDMELQTGPIPNRLEGKSVVEMLEGVEPEATTIVPPEFPDAPHSHVEVNGITSVVLESKPPTEQVENAMLTMPESVRKTLERPRLAPDSAYPHVGAGFASEMIALVSAPQDEMEAESLKYETYTEMVEAAERLYA